MNMKSLKLIAFDIDGVILKGGKVLPKAQQALKKVQTSKLPFIFLTNGGGCTEKAKATELFEKLNLHFDEAQIVLSHTPYRDYVSTYSDKPVLIVGNDKCLDVAHRYGFQLASNPQSIASNNSHIFPTLPKYTLTSNVIQAQSQQIKCDDVEAAFIFHDSHNWGLDIQVLIDSLLVEHPNHSPVKQRIPVFTCNSDIVYPTEYIYPRFTQGAFVHCLKSLYTQYSKGCELKVNHFGKPHSSQFEYAERVLLDQAASKGLLTKKNDQTVSDSEFAHIQFYMIGDNPVSDIRGSRSRGSHWHSVLVRTGIFTSSAENDSHDPADRVADDIDAAVDYVLNR